MRMACFDPSQFRFPRPKIPLLPNKLSLRRPSPAIHSTLEELKKGSANCPISFMRGRYALCEAYRLSGIRSGTALMVPAYHCLTMLDPAIMLEAEILLYPLNEDLSPDLARFDFVLAQTNKPVKALLATHFFGMVQDFTALKTWCEAKGITLIEDCSHVLFLEDYRAIGAGQFGKFVTSSPYKYFACEDGGLLFASEPSLLSNVNTKKRTLLDELRGLKHFLEKLRTSSPPLASETQLTELFRVPESTTELQISDYCCPSSHFVQTDQKKSALRVSRWTVEIESLASIAAERRKNYEVWANLVDTLPHCRSLYPKLPETCIPYMFPLLISKAFPHFHWLKQLGMPIWRWDELAVSECTVARHYQLHLLHLPCHQGLDESQIVWMTQTLSTLLKQPLEGLD